VLKEIVFQLGAEYCTKTSARIGTYLEMDSPKILDPNLNSVDMVPKSSCSLLQILEAVLEEMVLQLGAEY
jgi:hypothetical protein